MDDNVVSAGDISDLREQDSFCNSFRSDNSSNEDYIYQLEYEKRKHVNQIKSLQHQLDLSDRRNSELSDELVAANNLNHRLKDAAYENRNLQDTIEILSQSEINLKECCRHLKSSLSDCELKYTAKEQELRELENNLKNLEEHESFQRELLLSAKQQFESQQEGLECLLEKIEQLSSRIIQLENNFKHVRSRLLESEDELELLLQEKKSLQFKIQMIEENIITKSHFDDTGYLTSEAVSQIQVSNLEMNKCECKSIGEELENALHEISIYEEINEAESSTTEENEVIKSEDESVEKSSILHTESDINMQTRGLADAIPTTVAYGNSTIIRSFRLHIKEYIHGHDRRFLIVFLCIIFLFFEWLRLTISSLPCPLRIYSHPCPSASCDLPISGLVSSLFGFKITKLHETPPF